MRKRLKHNSRLSGCTWMNHLVLGRDIFPQTDLICSLFFCSLRSRWQLWTGNLLFAFLPFPRRFYSVTHTLITLHVDLGGHSEGIVGPEYDRMSSEMCTLLCPCNTSAVWIAVLILDLIGIQGAASWQLLSFTCFFRSHLLKNVGPKKCIFSIIAIAIFPLKSIWVLSITYLLQTLQIIVIRFSWKS